MTTANCRWCGRAFRPRSDGGKSQHFCRIACRRALEAAGRRWIAAGLVDGWLSIDALRCGPPATRALLDGPAYVGSGDEAISYLAPLDISARFVVDIPVSLIEGFIKIGWLRTEQQNDLSAIWVAMKKIGHEIEVYRVV